MDKGGKIGVNMALFALMGFTRFYSIWQYHKLFTMTPFIGKMIVDQVLFTKKGHKQILWPFWYIFVSFWILTRGSSNHTCKILISEPAYNFWKKCL